MRRIFMYPVEYGAYGPDGINGDHEQHYELFGAEKGQVARRTGWLDREIDWETSPLSDLYRTVDLVNRKYDPQRATFLTSDPLWMMSADASSYHYGYHDPMNMIDPWGLNGVTTVDQPGGGGGIGAGPSEPKGPRGTPTVMSWEVLFDMWWSDAMRQIGGTSNPGGGTRGGGLGPVGGSNGANGKTDVLPSSSKTGTGQIEVVGPVKLGQANILGGTLDNVAD